MKLWSFSSRSTNSRSSEGKAWDKAYDQAGEKTLDNRYLIKHLIGTGSYGYVVEALDLKSRDHVAIKTIDRVFDDLVDCKRILREVALLSALQHENVVRLVDICLPTRMGSFDEISLVLELCDCDLKQLLTTAAPITIVRIKRLLYHLFLGMMYIHSAGIYHRDMKPANCLINKDFTLKICDFGLARVKPRECGSALDASASLHQGRNIFSRQLTGHVVTRWYRAPELILLQPVYSETIDTWSLGCIIAEIFSWHQESNPTDRSPLFRGTCCFPLSPEHRRIDPDSNKEECDQLRLIFDVIGTPTVEEIEEIISSEVMAYVRCFPEMPRVDFVERYRIIPVEGVQLLDRMLCFSPKRRISMSEAVAHPFLAEVRQPHLEKVYQGNPIRLTFEDEKTLDFSTLRRHMVQEIAKFRPDAVNSFIKHVMDHDVLADDY